MITLKINGDSREFDHPLTLPALLESLGLEKKPVVIELNETALSPSEFEQSLSDGDCLEIIVIAAGG
ncbi:sulfur carrier protein ThiS [Akkermansiaceae bacterium]|nr:sulfur carrier protein ThiS [Akkermansiaceae bacterium]